MYAYLYNYYIQADFLSKVYLEPKKFTFSTLLKNVPNFAVGQC